MKCYFRWIDISALNWPSGRNFFSSSRAGSVQIRADFRFDARKQPDLPHEPPSQRHAHRLPRDMPWRVVGKLPHHRTPDPAGKAVTVPLASS
ncbi:hypothetical protein, partial [Burkholderia sp. LMG 13014]